MGTTSKGVPILPTLVPQLEYLKLYTPIPLRVCALFVPFFAWICCSVLLDGVVFFYGFLSLDERKIDLKSGLGILWVCSIAFRASISIGIHASK